MSVIENALSKMRRNAATPAAESAAVGAVPEPSPPQSRMTIDFARLLAERYLPEAAEERRFADYYRAVKRPIIQRATAAEASIESRLIVVTSALPGEGKTFTTLNLALSIAREHDVSVLLVDADLPKTHLSTVLGVRERAGLFDALVDESRDIESLVLRTDVRGFEFLPSGRHSEGAAELVASARMAQLVTRLAARSAHRIVLFDSAPLLVSSEARALIQLPGQVVLVVRSGHTPRQALLEAIGLVNGNKLHGLVLNDAHVAADYSYYGYYGYPGSYPDPSSADARDSD
jgi:protein-tyrosine kinase